MWSCGPPAVNSDAHSRVCVRKVRISQMREEEASISRDLSTYSFGTSAGTGRSSWSAKLPSEPPPLPLTRPGGQVVRLARHTSCRGRPPRRHVAGHAPLPPPARQNRASKPGFSMFLTLRESADGESAARPRRPHHGEPGGEGGIRTHGGHGGHNGFRDRPIQPLWHLSQNAPRL